MPASPPARRSAWLPRLVALHAELFRLLRKLGWPLFDLAVRIGLAQGFFISGVLKVTHWQNALYLARYQYPVSWMDPLAAACTGAAIELVCPILLAGGLLTRYAAVPMLILSLVVQFSYNPLDTQLFAAALFGWYAIAGAGPLSLDAMLRRGLADSALPLAARIVRLSGWVRAQLTPYYLSALRAWLGLAVLVAPLHRAFLWLPSSLMPWPAALGMGAGLLLLPGLATRYVAIGLMLLGAGAAMMPAGSAPDPYLFAVLAVLVIQGGGRLAVDAALAALMARRYPQLQGKPAFALDGLPRVVIVGAGFAGLSCAAGLRRARASVTLIDRDNYHLFQPLLYQVATAALSPGDIATPIRSLFRDAFNTRVLLKTVTGVDTARQQVLMGQQALEYDFLVLATGAEHSYFGKDHWQAFAPGLKRIGDATAIRRRLLMAFEQAEATEDAQQRAALLTFLIVGGGPTGVELAGAIAELARYGMEKEFRRFDPADARVVLVQSAARLLPSFHAELAAFAQRDLERLGVEVLLGNRVEDIDAAGVAVSGRRIAARTVLWAAGVKASSAAHWLGIEADSAGRAKVEPDLSIRAHPNVFAIGDTALCAAWKNGQPVPGLAPAAQQAGAHVARVIGARLAGRVPPGRFVYRHRGSLATVGRKAAVADFGIIRLWGAPAWWLWGLVHVGFLVGLRNRVSTMTNWFWAYLTLRGGIRLITGDERPTP
jgi:NADH dehydrogenase/putative oxidoreductase